MNWKVCRIAEPKGLLTFCLAEPKGLLTFCRQSVAQKTAEEWQSSALPIPSLTCDDKLLIEDMEGMLQVDFANRLAKTNVRL